MCARAHPCLHISRNSLSAAIETRRERACVVHRLSEFATLPVRGSALAAGYDLSASTDTVVPARGKALVKTDLAMAIPEGHYGRIGA